MILAAAAEKLHSSVFDDSAIHAEFDADIQDTVLELETKLKYMYWKQRKTAEKNEELLQKELHEASLRETGLRNELHDASLRETELMNQLQEALKRETDLQKQLSMLCLRESELVKQLNDRGGQLEANQLNQLYARVAGKHGVSNVSQKTFYLTVSCIEQFLHNSPMYHILTKAMSLKCQLTLF